MPDEIKMSIRLRPDLHGRLSRAADRDHRSMHAQMIVYIERGLDLDERRARAGQRARDSKGEDEDGAEGR